MPKMTNFRWTICALLFFATTVNYLDRQVLSLTWKDFIAPEFHWTDTLYGYIGAAFTIVYAISNLLSGRFIDWIGTRKGYLWAIGIWSTGACLHALCGVATQWSLDLHGTEAMLEATGATATTIATVSVWFFIGARIILGLGEGGNFPSAIKVTTEYFPRRDRAFATSIFNAGATAGALVAPLCIPALAQYFKNIGWGNGWEMAFIIIGGLGYVWMGLWIWLYRHPGESRRVNKAELDYIRQDAATEAGNGEDGGPKVPLARVIRLPQTWGIFLAKLVTDGAWWFFLFWTPAYISDNFGLKASDPTAMALMFVLYAITMLSIFGGKLPTIIINRTRLNSYDARLKAMLAFALIPLLAIAAQPLGEISYWWPIIIIGLVGAAHQSWSANLYSVASDLFPRSVVGTITGINGLAGGISGAVYNALSGRMFDYAEQSHMCIAGFEGKPAGYFIVFCVCAVAYLAGWCILKTLVPRYKAVVV